MDQIINLGDYIPLSSTFHEALRERLEMAQRDFPNMKIMYVGRPSALANPFKVANKKDMNQRRESVAKYRRYLWFRLRAKDTEIGEALESIDENTVLAGWCHPLPCHSQVIWAAWHWWKAEGSLQLRKGEGVMVS